MQNTLKTDYKSIVAEVKAVIREIYTYSCIGIALPCAAFVLGQIARWGGEENA